MMWTCDLVSLWMLTSDKIMHNHYDVWQMLLLSFIMNVDQGWKLQRKYSESCWLWPYKTSSCKTCESAGYKHYDVVCDCWTNIKIFANVTAVLYTFKWCSQLTDGFIKHATVNILEVSFPL